jgi:hypothetical protein
VGRHALSPRRPYSRVFLAHSRRHLRIRFGNKVHPAARSSILGHRVSGNAIRSGGMPALVYAAIKGNPGQERDFHSARPRRLWKTLSSTSLLRSHYKGNAGMRPERRLSGRNGRGGVSRPVVKHPFWRNCVKSRGRRGRAPVLRTAMTIPTHDEAPFSNSAGETYPRAECSRF